MQQLVLVDIDVKNEYETIFKNLIVWGLRYKMKGKNKV